MKKTILTLFAAAALLFCGCEKDDPNNPGNGDNNETTVDVTPYLGKFLMTRHANLTISVVNMFNFPLDRDFNIETVTVKEDPNTEHGIIMTSNDGMLLHGVVDSLGLHLNNDTIAFAIDTMGINTAISVTMVHPVIAPPTNGSYDWTSVATGSATVTLYGIPVNATLTGELHYHSIFGK